MIGLIPRPLHAVLDYLWGIAFTFAPEMLGYEKNDAANAYSKARGISMIGISLLTLVPGEIGGAETAARGLVAGLAEIGTLAVAGARDDHELGAQQVDRHHDRQVGLVAVGLLAIAAFGCQRAEPNVNSNVISNANTNVNINANTSAPPLAVIAPRLAAT